MDINTSCFNHHINQVKIVSILIIFYAIYYFFTRKSANLHAIVQVAVKLQSSKKASLWDALFLFFDYKRIEAYRLNFLLHILGILSVEVSSHLHLPIPPLALIGYA